jgi:hypothetical protein
MADFDCDCSENPPHVFLAIVTVTTSFGFNGPAVTVVTVDPKVVLSRLMMNNVIKVRDWRRGLQLSGQGEPRGNLFSVLHALRNAPDWTDALAYDEFALKEAAAAPHALSDMSTVSNRQAACVGSVLDPCRPKCLILLDCVDVCDSANMRGPS